MATNNITYRGDVSGILNTRAVPGAFIGTLLMPIVLVDRQEDYFWKRDGRQRLKAVDGTRTPSTTAKRDKAGLIQDTYQCVQHRLEAEIAEEHVRKYEQWNIDWINMRAQDKQMELLRGREIRIASKIFNQSTFPLSGTTGLNLSDEWDDHTNATPVDDIAFGQECVLGRCGMYADTLVLPNMLTAIHLSMCDQVRSKLGINDTPGAQGRALIPFEMLLAALHPALRKIRIGGEMYDATPDAPAATNTPIWNPEYAALLVTSDGSDDLTEMCIGKTIAYSEEGGAFDASQYREEPISSEIVRVQDCTDEKILVDTCGFLFGNVNTI